MGIINKNKVKSLGLKIIVLLLGVFGFLTTSHSEAVNMMDAKYWLNYAVSISGAYMDQYFSMVHFNVKGNDFGGGLLWLPVEQITGDAVEITIPTGNPDEPYDSVFCTSKIRGFYWNSQRGDNRLWPLDDKTHKRLSENADRQSDPELYKNLEFSGGRYTTCSEDRPTAELKQYLDEKGVSLSNSKLAEIVDKLEKTADTPDRSLWTPYITGVLAEYDITNEETIDKISAAILADASFKSDPYGIYGRIIHKFWWEKIDLVAGAHYDMEQNRISEGNLTCSLQRLGNNYPFGYLYDDYGHIGIVGARITYDYIQGAKKGTGDDFHLKLNNVLNDGYCMNQVFGYDGENITLLIRDDETKNQGVGISGWCESAHCGNLPYHDGLKDFFTAGNGTARTTVFSLGIKGIIGLTDEVRDAQKEYFENNQLQSTLMLRTETSISNIVNTVNKNAEALCRGRWITNVTPGSRNSSKLVCYEGKGVNDSITVSPKDLKGKSVVLRNASLEIDMSNVNEYQGVNDAAINLFIDKGNLYISSIGEEDVSLLPCFDDYGYLSDQSLCVNNEDAIRAMFLKGNFIINGLILGGYDDSGIIGKGIISSRLYAHGKIVSYNTLTVPTAGRKKTIEKILGSSPNYSEYEGVSFMKLFGWGCNPVEGYGSDGTSCKGSSAVGKESQLVDKAFGLIDMDIPGELVNY